MKLQTKVFIPVIASLVILGGSMYLLNRQILKELFNKEATKVLIGENKGFNNLLEDRINFVSQYSNMLANTFAIRSAFEGYAQSKNIDVAWNVINSEVDRIKFNGYKSGLIVPPINCHLSSGKVLFRSRSGKKGDNILGERPLIAEALRSKKSISGIEIGKYGLDIRGVSPIMINKKFYGTIETVYPLNQIVDEIRSKESDAYALFVFSAYTNKINNIDSLVSTEDLYEDGLIIRKSNEFKNDEFVKAYKEFLETNNLVLGQNYNHVFIPIQNYKGNEIALLVFQMNNTDFISNMNASSYSLFFIGIIIFLISVLILFLVLNRMVINPIKRVTRVLLELSKGIVADKLKITTKDEVALMQNAINTVNDGMRSVSNFAIEIGNENYEGTFSALSDEDELGNTMLQVRDKLKAVAEQEQQQNIIDEQRNWSVKGQAKFAALLQNDSKKIDEYTYLILSNLISYLNINQGAMFLLAPDDKTLVYSSSYAYDRRKYSDKEFLLGEGLIGNTALERKMTYLTDIPQDYIEITSGLGESAPTSLLIVPLITNDELLGVFELASFRVLQQFELDFCQTIAENIAQSISRFRINSKTEELLEQSKQQTEELSAQEEEMRQNLEEMHATQEEMLRKEAEMSGVVNALNSSTLLVEFNLEGDIINVNDRILTVFGLQSKEEVLGANHKDFYNSEGYTERANELWERISKKETVSRKARVLLPNGNEVWLNETYSPVLDENGGILKVLNISFDITEEENNKQQLNQQHEEMQAQEEEMRQNLEEMQSQEEEMLQNFEEMQATQDELADRESESKALYNSVKQTVLFAEFSLDQKITDINDKFAATFGIDREHMIGKEHKVFASYSSNKDKYARLWKKVLKGEVVNIFSEFNFNDKIFSIEETYSPVVSENGTVLKVINVSVLRS